MHNIHSLRLVWTVYCWLYKETQQFEKYYTRLRNSINHPQHYDTLGQDPVSSSSHRTKKIY